MQETVAMNSVLGRFSGRTKLLWALCAVGVLAIALPTAASSPLAANRKVVRYDVKVANSDIEAGGAKASVMAPTAVVKSVITDYAKYAKVISKFEQARVVGKSGDRTDVYLQVPILKGAAKIWAVVRFDQPQRNEKSEVVKAKMVKGNVKRLDAVWRIREVDEQNSELELELLIVPDMPAPRSLVVSEARGAAAKAVTDARREAERRQVAK
jgi:ribosome-associated toxin RatA of RatAB toxin-antitoxin module